MELSRYVFTYLLRKVTKRIYYIYVVILFKLVFDMRDSLLLYNSPHSWVCMSYLASNLDEKLPKDWTRLILYPSDALGRCGLDRLETTILIWSHNIAYAEKFYVQSTLSLLITTY